MHKYTDVGLTVQVNLGKIYVLWNSKIDFWWIFIQKYITTVENYIMLKAFGYIIHTKILIYSRELPVLDLQATWNNVTRNGVKRGQPFPGILLIYDPLISNLSILFKCIWHWKQKILNSMTKINSICLVPVLQADLHETYSLVSMNLLWLPREDKIWNLYWIYCFIIMSGHLRFVITFMDLYRLDTDILTTFLSVFTDLYGFICSQGPNINPYKSLIRIRK